MRAAQIAKGAARFGTGEKRAGKVGDHFDHPIEVRNRGLVFSEQLICRASLKIILGGGLHAHGTIEILDRPFRIAALPEGGAAQGVRRCLIRIYGNGLRSIIGCGLKIIEVEIGRTPSDPPGRIGRTQFDYFREIAKRFLGIGLFDVRSSAVKIARYNQAILSFDRAVALKPDLVDAFMQRGNSFVGNARQNRSGRYADFSKVIELHPAAPNGWVARGAAYLDLNNFQAAIADASQAIIVNPKDAAAFNLRGSAIRKNGDAKKALEDFNRAVELAPNADNYYQRGATYQLLGDHQSAIADFTQVIDMIPDLGHAYFARAESRRAIGDIAGAEQDHRQGRYFDGRSCPVSEVPERYVAHTSGVQYRHSCGRCLYRSSQKQSQTSTGLSTLHAWRRAPQPKG